MAEEKQTDALPMYNASAELTQRSITIGILTEAIEVIQKCADGNLAASTYAARFLKKHGYR